MPLNVVNNCSTETLFVQPRTVLVLVLIELAKLGTTSCSLQLMVLDLDCHAAGLRSITSLMRSCIFFLLR